MTILHADSATLSRATRLPVQFINRQRKTKITTSLPSPWNSRDTNWDKQLECALVCALLWLLDRTHTFSRPVSYTAPADLWMVSAHVPTSLNESQVSHVRQDYRARSRSSRKPCESPFTFPPCSLVSASALVLLRRKKKEISTAL